MVSIMAYQKILKKNERVTQGLMKARCEEIGAADKKAKEIDTALRTYATDQKLLEFLTARAALATLVEEEYGGGYRPSVSLTGRGCISLHVYGDNDHFIDYKLVEVNSSPHVEKEEIESYKDFVGEDGLAFVCVDSTWTFTHRGEMLAKEYNSTRFKDQTPENLEKTLEKSLENLVKTKK